MDYVGIVSQAITIYYYELYEVIIYLEIIGIYLCARLL